MWKSDISKSLRLWYNVFCFSEYFHYFPLTSKEKPMLQRILCAFAIVTLTTTMLFAADWLAFRGANGEGKSPDVGLLKKWPEGGPKLLWTADFIGFFGGRCSNGAIVRQLLPVIKPKL